MVDRRSLCPSRSSWFRNRGSDTSPDPNLETAALYNWVTLVAAVYVISQELLPNNINLENTVDSFDVVASWLGLVLINHFLRRVGMLSYSHDAG